MSFHELCVEHFCRCLIPQTFAGRCVEAIANRPQISICERRGISLAGKVAAQPVVRVLNRTLLPRCGGVTEPRISTKTVLHMLPGTELRSTIKGNGLARVEWQGGQAVNQAFHDRFRLPPSHTCFACVAGQRSGFSRMTAKRLTRSTNDVTLALPNSLRNMTKSHSQWPN